MALVEVLGRTLAEAEDFRQVGQFRIDGFDRHVQTMPFMHCLPTLPIDDLVLTQTLFGTIYKSKSRYRVSYAPDNFEVIRGAGRTLSEAFKDFGMWLGEAFEDVYHNPFDTYRSKACKDALLGSIKRKEEPDPRIEEGLKDATHVAFTYIDQVVQGYPLIVYEVGEFLKPYWDPRKAKPHIFERKRNGDSYSFDLDSDVACIRKLSADGVTQVHALDPMQPMPTYVRNVRLRRHEEHTPFACERLLELFKDAKIELIYL